MLGMVSHQLVFVTMPKRWYFYQKLKDTACHLKQSEPYSCWSNAAEREIKELKKGASNKLLQSKAPSAYGMISYKWRPILGPILSMRFISKMGRYPRQ